MPFHLAEKVSSFLMYLQSNEYKTLRENLIKEIIDKDITTPIFKLDITKLIYFEPKFLKEFRKDPEKVLTQFQLGLIDLVGDSDRNIEEIINPARKIIEGKYELDHQERDLLKLFKGIHIIPFCPSDEDADVYIPLKESIMGNLVDYLYNVYRFRLKYMEVGLIRNVLFLSTVFKCLICGSEFSVYQAPKKPIKFPRFCINPRCKAKSKSDFTLLEEKSLPIESRKFTIVSIDDKDFVSPLNCFIYSNIPYFLNKARDLYSNEEITLLGILKLDVSDLYSNRKNADPKYYIEVLDIDHENKTMIDEDAIKKIREKLKEDDEYFLEILNAIHPISANIREYLMVKLIMTLSWVTSDCFEHGGSGRNGLNVIIGAHKGNFKSSIATSYSRILGDSNFGYIGGKNITDAGLIPTMQRSDKNEGILKRVGVLHMYTKRTLVIDEAQYLRPKNLQDLKALDEGRISRSIEGTKMTVSTEGTVILMVNYSTEKEKYDYSKPFTDNLDIFKKEPSNLDRFDLHYAIPNITPLIKETISIRQMSKKKIPEPKFSINEIRSYLLKTKQWRTEINPTLSPEMQILIAKFIRLLSEGRGEGDILSHRETPTMIRILKAIASLRFKDTIDESDLDFYKKYLSDKVIPFQHNFVATDQSFVYLDMKVIFKECFRLLAESRYGVVEIEEMILLIREHLEKHFFNRIDHDPAVRKRSSSLFGLVESLTEDKKRKLFNIDHYMPITEKSLLNNHYKKLHHDSELRHFIEKEGYMVTIRNKKSVYLKKSRLKTSIYELFKSNRVRALEYKNILELVEFEHGIKEKDIKTYIEELVNKGYLEKKGENLILK